MPTYEYACTKCGHQFEAFQSFSDEALTECPECKGEVQKVYSNVGVVFKGSGFYKTDSRTTKPAQPSKTPAAPTPPPAPKND
jgi:putative FmdB family regulatory protein